MVHMNILAEALNFPQCWKRGKRQVHVRPWSKVIIRFLPVIINRLHWLIWSRWCSWSWESQIKQDECLCSRKTWAVGWIVFVDCTRAGLDLSLRARNLPGANLPFWVASHWHGGVNGWKGLSYCHEPNAQKLTCSGMFFSWHKLQVMIKWLQGEGGIRETRVGSLEYLVKSS